MTSVGLPVPPTPDGCLEGGFAAGEGDSLLANAVLARELAAAGAAAGGGVVAADAGGFSEGAWPGLGSGGGAAAENRDESLALSGVGATGPAENGRLVGGRAAGGTAAT